MTGPEISCIIPGYERADLMARCLTSVTAQRGVKSEIIVTDDSASSTIRDLVSSLRAFSPIVDYVEGPKSGNPVDNWNAGLARARAPLRVLIHHDEFLVDRHYFRRAVDALSQSRAAAALAGVSVVGVDRPSRFALVAPLARLLPAARRLLPLINWIGPTAAFVFRAGPLFDRRLTLLTEVEFYGRVLANGTLFHLSGVSVGSLGHHDGQITATLDRTNQALEELTLLASRRPAGLSAIEHSAFAVALKLKRRFE